MINALTADGEIHLPAAGPSGPTTACGRTERVYVIDHYVTCPECLAAEKRLDELRARADELLDELLEES